VSEFAIVPRAVLDNASPRAVLVYALLALPTGPRTYEELAIAADCSRASLFRALQELRDKGVLGDAMPLPKRRRKSLTGETESLTGETAAKNGVTGETLSLTGETVTSLLEEEKKFSSAVEPPRDPQAVERIRELAQTVRRGQP
jgi:hypothetical protein